MKGQVWMPEEHVNHLEGDRLRAALLRLPRSATWPPGTGRVVPEGPLAPPLMGFKSLGRVGEPVDGAVYIFDFDAGYFLLTLFAIHKGRIFEVGMGFFGLRPGSAEARALKAAANELGAVAATLIRRRATKVLHGIEVEAAGVSFRLMR